MGWEWDWDGSANRTGMGVGIGLGWELDGMVRDGDGMEYGAMKWAFADGRTGSTTLTKLGEGGGWY